MNPFLEFFGAAGNILHVRLPQAEPFASCFLPDQVEDNINFCPFRVCNSHSTVRLQIFADYLLLSVWDVDISPIHVLSHVGVCTQVPGSTHSQEILFMLTDNCQFLSPAGRWKIHFCHNEVTSGSMKPPAVPRRPIKPPDIAVKALNILANGESDERDTRVQNRNLDSVESFSMSDAIDKSTVFVKTGTSMSNANGISEIVQNQQSLCVAVESGLSHSPKDVTKNLISSITAMSPTPATYQRKKLIDMEYHNNPEPKIVTPRPRKRVRFNPNGDQQSPPPVAKLPDEHLWASPQQPKQDTFHQKSGEVFQELPEPETDSLRETNLTHAPEMNKFKHQSDALDRRSMVWPSSFRGPLPDQPGVVFSSNCTVQTRRKTIRTLIQLGGTVVNDVDRADILCIPDGPLKRTTKFVLAMALGKVVVTEDWIVSSSRQQVLQCVDKFIPKDNIREQQWGFSILKAMKRNPLENGKILKDWKIYITPQLTKDLGDIVMDFEKIAKALGASRFSRGLPKEHADPELTLILGCDNDVDIRRVEEMGFNIYGKDALVSAALRGRHDAHSNEFML